MLDLQGITGYLCQTKTHSDFHCNNYLANLISFLSRKELSSRTGSAMKTAKVLTEVTTESLQQMATAEIPFPVGF